MTLPQGCALLDTPPTLFSSPYCASLWILRWAGSAKNNQAVYWLVFAANDATNCNVNNQRLPSNSRANRLSHKNLSNFSNLNRNIGKKGEITRFILTDVGGLPSGCGTHVQDVLMLLRGECHDWKKTGRSLNDVMASQIFRGCTCQKEDGVPFTTEQNCLPTKCSCA